MVNLVAAHKTLLHGLMKMAGVQPYTVDIEPGTLMRFWVPCETVKKPKKGEKKTSNINKDQLDKPTKPAVVLVHGFSGDGIFTWQFQVGALTKKYSVYIPDLIFFGGSTTDQTDRSPTFQAHCLAKGMAKLGIDKCFVVGFSYGGTVAFKLAELYPVLVRAIVVSCSILAMTDSISETLLSRLGFSSLTEMMLPDSVKGLKSLFSVATHMKLRLPDRLYKDYLEVMFTYRKERAELLEGLVISNNDQTIPNFPQRIHLLWGENDRIFNVELAHNMKQQLGDNATFQGIEKGGHLVHLERPCVYNRRLKQFLASLHADISEK